jgi:hypothetical protein
VVGWNLGVTATSCAVMAHTGLELKMIVQRQEVILLQSIPKQKMISSMVWSQEPVDLRVYFGWEDQIMHQR